MGWNPKKKQAKRETNPEKCIWVIRTFFFSYSLFFLLHFFRGLMWWWWVVIRHSSGEAESGGRRKKTVARAPVVVTHPFWCSLLFWLNSFSSFLLLLFSPARALFHCSHAMERWKYIFLFCRLRFFSHWTVMRARDFHTTVRLSRICRKRAYTR